MWLRSKHVLHSASTAKEQVGDTEEQRLLELGRDLDQLWNHAATTASLKKRLLRTVLEEIVVNLSDDPPRIHMRLHWSGGVHTDLKIAKNTTGRHKRCTDRNVIDLARELAKVCEDKSIAAILNRLGYRTGHDNTWTLSRVRTMRSHYRIPAFNKDESRSWVTLDQAAKELEVGRHLVRGLIRRGTLPAQQVVRCAPWVAAPATTAKNTPASGSAKPRSKSRFWRCSIAFASRTKRCGVGFAGRCRHTRGRVNRTTNNSWTN